MYANKADDIDKMLYIFWKGFIPTESFHETLREMKIEWQIEWELMTACLNSVFTLPK